MKNILKIAQEILLKLKHEVGVTRTSLENLDKILSNGYELHKATLNFERSDKAVLHVEFINEDDETFTWDFTGFSAGYGGEGPRGLASAMKMLNIRNWDMSKIVDLKPGNYKVAAFERPSIIGPKTVSNVTKYIKVKDSTNYDDLYKELKFLLGENVYWEDALSALVEVNPKADSSKIEKVFKTKEGTSLDSYIEE